MKTKTQIENMIKKLKKADLNVHVFEEVEYGKYWLSWVLELEKDPDREYGKHEHCKCEVLWKLLATNFPYYYCPTCGRKYFSSGRSKVVDKIHLGSAVERKKKGLKY